MRAFWRRLLCRLLGHRRWYYEPVEAPEDLWFGCVRCRDSRLVRDKIEIRPHPEHPDLVLVDPSALERLRARLEMMP